MRLCWLLKYSANVLIYPSRTFEHRPKWVVLVLMQDPLLKQKQNPFVAAAVGCICLSLHYPTRSSHWSARRPSIIATFSCVKNRAVFHGDSIVFLKRWWGLNSGVLYPGKPPVPSLPSVFYFYYHSPFFSPTIAATFTSGCLHTKKKKKKIWRIHLRCVISSSGIRLDKLEAFSFPWIHPPVWSCWTGQHFNW